MLETLSEYFYNPWIFWSVPLLLALIQTLLQRTPRWRRKDR